MVGQLQGVLGFLSPGVLALPGMFFGGHRFVSRFPCHKDRFDVHRR